MSGAVEYPAAVWERFRATRRAGPPPAGAAVGRGGDRRMGGDIEVWVVFEAGRVARVGFRAFGCPFTVAAADLACERLQGRQAGELASFDAEALIAELAVPPERFAVRIWLEDAVRSAAAAGAVP